MSRVVRSPTQIELQHTMSDTDITKVHQGIATPPVVSQRNKRQRQSSEEKMCSFRDEIRDMLKDWKETQNGMLNKLISEVAKIKEQNIEIKQTNEEIEKSLLFVNQQYEDMRQKVEDLESERKKQLLKIAMLESLVEDTQRNLKASSLEVRNVPITSITKTNTDLCKVVVDTCKAIGVNIQNTEIRNVFSINSKSGKSTIVADFTSVVLRNNVLQGVKSFRKQNPDRHLTSLDIGVTGQQVPIYISEALTSKSRRLFFLARDVAKTKDYKFCWSSNGKVYLRKNIDTSRIEIRDEVQLANLRGM